MIKKIKVEQLKPGMFVHDIDASWEDYPFLTKKFLVKSEGVIKKFLESGIKEVYIDTSKGLDVKDAPTKEEIAKEIEKDIKKIGETGGFAVEIEDMKNEFEKTKDFIERNQRFFKRLMKEVTLKRPIDKKKLTAIIDTLNQEINKETLVILLKIKDHSNYTYLHSVSVGSLMHIFCEYMEIPRHIKEDVVIGSFLHDVGKCYIPDKILNKPSKLSKAEYNFVKKHVDFSKEILENFGDFSQITITTAYQHHERYDGSGYPRGLKGDKITKFGQMIGIVDVYDAITSNKSYHKGMDPAIAVRKIYEWSDTLFNRELAQHFIKCIGVYPIGSLVKLKSNFLAIVIKQNPKNLTLPVVLKIYNIEKDEFLEKPYSVDLANDDDEIVSLESTVMWNIDIFKYLQISP